MLLDRIETNRSVYNFVNEWVFSLDLLKEGCSRLVLSRNQTEGLYRIGFIDMIRQIGSKKNEYR